MSSEASVYRVPLFINGEEVFASDGKTFEVKNPYSHQVVSISASASQADCKAAVDAAATAFKTWEKTTPSQRRKIFLKAADIIESDVFKKRILEACGRETAQVAVTGWGMVNVMASANLLREAAALASSIKGETFQSEKPGTHVIAQRRAAGVVLGIAPWNAPVNLSFRAVAVPIICGNTAVLKSSEVSPRSQAIVYEALRDAGLPKGVLNYISISRADAPQRTAELIAHPAVKRINFTGSDKVGKIIAQEAAKHLKQCVFELGGKAPFIVFEDANLEEAAKAITFSGLMHSGQICMSTERVIVHESVSSKLVSLLSELFAKIKAGDPSTNPDHRLAALFTEASAENVIAQIEEAKLQGAQVAFGNLQRQGHVVQPHILTNVKPGMSAFDHESFGPVVAVTNFNTEEEAIELANASEYSLMAALWTRDLGRAFRVAPEIRAGATQVNGSTVHIEPALGNAGLGGATGYGRFNVEHFTDLRMITVHPDTPGHYPLLAGL